MNHAKQIITAAGTAISIISLGFSSYMPTLLTGIIVVAGLVCFFILLYDEIKNNTHNERICKSKEAEEDAMKDIINSQGKICIMSRDLSWVTPEILACLEAKKTSTLIFAQSENDITKLLIARGVAVKYYGDLGFEPKTRFTIIRYNKNDPQVAIANIQNSIRKRNKFEHIIYQTSASGSRQDEWINSLAVDMVQLCNLVCKENSDAQEN